MDDSAEKACRLARVKLNKTEMAQLRFSIDCICSRSQLFSQITCTEPTEADKCTLRKDEPVRGFEVTDHLFGSINEDGYLTARGSAK